MSFFSIKWQLFKADHLFLGVSRRKGGSGYALQTFFAEKAQKGFPLLSLTQIHLRPSAPLMMTDLRF